MKEITCLLLLISHLSVAQIKNPGFEIKEDSMQMLPGNWGWNKMYRSLIKLDSNIKSSGNLSLRIDNSKDYKYQNFSQTILFRTQELKKIVISAFVKTDKLKGDAGLWCQARDRNDKMVGSANSLYFKIDSTLNWKKYSFALILNKDVDKLVLGGDLEGTGTAWYDDFAIEDISVNNAETAPEQVSKFINQFIDTVKLHSLYADSVNWISLNNDLEKLSKGIKTIEDSYSLLDYILSKIRAAGDNHSFIMPKWMASQISEGNTIGMQPEGKYAGNDIGYVKVPAFNALNDTAKINFAEGIQKIIKTIDSENNITGWIVDLRENTGGNMYPMIAGLGPILGKDTLGYSISSDKKIPWYFSGDGAGEGNELVVKLKNSYSIKNPKSKVAVLINNNTGSSGEFTTISFIGKPNTKLFGQPTAGFTTGNERYLLSDGSFLLLAEGIAADRNMKKYPKKIYPDVEVNCVINTDGDSCIEAAKKWIMNK